MYILKLFTGDAARRPEGDGHVGQEAGARREGERGAGPVSVQ